MFVISSWFNQEVWPKYSAEICLWKNLTKAFSEISEQEGSGHHQVSIQYLNSHAYVHRFVYLEYHDIIIRRLRLSTHVCIYV